ncbi:MAG: hypothetical protein JW772_02775 [Candidatus Diapherotrites archaeon]|nr:hypothetical protein [Candidatus Diapherotrites archaeon]
MHTLLLFALMFFVSVGSVFFAAKKMRGKGIVGKDINKRTKLFLPEATGIALLVPLWIGMAYIVAFENFSPVFMTLALAVTGYAIIGFLDDLKKKIRGSLSWKTRAVPVIAFSLVFAYLFTPNLWWTPLLAVFIGGLAALENTFAGLNGWEIGSGFIISCFVAVFLFNTQFFPLAIIISAMILGLLFWNFYPAKVFPGDSGTLLIGSAIACLTVLTENIFLMAMVFLFFLPHLIDFFALKILTNRKDLSQKKFFPYRLLDNGKLGLPNYSDKVERLDFAKMLVKLFGPMKEWQVVALIWVIVFLNCCFWFFAFKAVNALVF